MALNFPSSPTANTTYTFNGKSWTYNGSAWALDYGTLNTGVVTEGVNLYFTNARSRASISVTGSGSYDNSTGVITISGGGGSTYDDSNVALLGYATNANVALKANITDLTTANVVELTNLYFTDARVYSAVTGNLALKSNVADLTTANVTELTNLYFTNARSRASISVTGSGTYDSANGIINITSSGGSTYDDSNVALLGYATNANVALKANVADLTTANVTELINLYFTDTRARDTISVDGFGEYDNTTGIVSIYQQNVSVNGRIGPVSGLAETNNSLSQFASTTSLELITLISWF